MLFFNAILLTVVSLGPIGWFLIDLFAGNTERLLFLFIASVIGALLDGALWTFAILSHLDREE